MYRVDDWESLMRPPPASANEFVVYASCQDIEIATEDVILAALEKFPDTLGAVDVFSTSRQIGLAFVTAEAADDAFKAGLTHDETVIPLARRVDHRPNLKKLTVSGMNCTDPHAACAALVQYFGNYGRVVDV
jgi:hypothetical protein